MSHELQGFFLTPTGFCLTNTSWVAGIFSRASCFCGEEYLWWWDTLHPSPLKVSRKNKELLQTRTFTRNPWKLEVILQLASPLLYLKTTSENPGQSHKPKITLCPFICILFVSDQQDLPEPVSRIPRRCCVIISFLFEGPSFVQGDNP